MTPPTTPPSSDWTFGTSPNGISRAMHASGWKKMGAKLGLGKKSRSKRSQTTSVPSPGYGYEIGLPDARQSTSNPL
jgi:hypothetical protein